MPHATYTGPVSVWRDAEQRPQLFEGDLGTFQAQDRFRKRFGHARWTLETVAANWDAAYPLWVTLMANWRHKNARKAGKKPRTERRQRVKAAAARVTPPPTSAGEAPQIPAKLLARLDKVKAENPAALLVFRITGADRYAFHPSDADTAAGILRGLLGPDRTVEARLLPHVLRKLVAAGHRVAVCDEVQKPAPIAPRRKKTDTAAAAAE